MPEQMTSAESHEANATPEHWATGSEYFEAVKHYATPHDCAKGYVELQKSSSAKVKIPEEGDIEGLNKFHARMGRPDSPDGYKTTMPDGVEMDKELEAAMRQTAFENGDNQKKWDAQLATYNRVVAERNEKLAEANEKLNTDRWERLGWDEDKKKTITELVRREIEKFSEKHPVPEGEMSFIEVMLDKDDDGNHTVLSGKDAWLIAYSNYLMDHEKSDSGLHKGDPASGDEEKPDHGPETYAYGDLPATIAARAYWEKQGYSYEENRWLNKP
jgi:hypothetical protein